MDISYEMIILLVSVILTSGVAIFSYYIFRNKMKQENFYKITKNQNLLKSKLNETVNEIDKINMKISSMSINNDKYYDKINKSSNIQGILNDTIVINDRLSRLEERLKDAKVFTKTEGEFKISDFVKGLNDRISELEQTIKEIKLSITNKDELEKAQQDKIQLENQKLERDIQLETFKHFPSRTWPKWISTLGISITSATLSFAGYLFFQGLNYWVIMPMITFGICILFGGLLFWVRDDNDRIKEYQERFNEEKKFK